MDKIQLPKSGYFIVYEDKWVNGDNEFQVINRSSLLNAQGNSCCVGHFLRDCGVPKSILNGKQYISTLVAQTHVPAPVSSNLIKWEARCSEITAVDIDGSSVTYSIYRANDDKDLTTSLRKQILRALFMKQFGLRIVFKKKSPEKIAA